MRAKHDSIRTEKNYSGWIKDYVKFHGMRHPREMGEIIGRPLGSAEKSMAVTVSLCTAIKTGRQGRSF
ncbi:MAG: hypothetical protein DRN14_07850 [Thermoplasmata archaeon]|nr:MAG: hypothetical protein DRN14_07850 [Thermoplasmata archaeon]